MPERVAAVDELVGAALEAALDGHLAAAEPSFEGLKVDGVSPSENDEGGERTKYVTAVGLAAWLSAKAALVRLARHDVVDDALPARRGCGETGSGVLTRAPA